VADTAGRTLPELLHRAAGARPGKTFLITPHDELTYGEFAARSGSVAGALVSAGVGHGDRVTVCLPNCTEFVLLLFACARIGAVFAPVNPDATAAELAGLLRQAGPRLVIGEQVTPTLLAATRDACIDDDRVVTARALCTGTNVVPPAAGTPGDTLVLIPTSGSTNAPKLVAHSQSSSVLAAEGFPAWVGLDETDRMLTPLPLFHGNALLYSLLGSLGAAASLVLLPRFSVRQFWDLTREFAVTQFNLIGNMGEILLRTPQRDNDADNPVRVCYSAWAPPEERHREFEQRFGLDIVIGYGLSETSYGTVWPLGGPKPFGSIGRLRQHPALGRINEARIVDENLQPVAPGAPGVLMLRNPAVMQGYFGMADETKAVLQDGWLNTGDIVRMNEDGYVYFVGRNKDIIRRSGENFAPIEVEEALDSHPGVFASAVIAVPARLADDDAKAFVVRSEASAVTATELLEWCRDRLARFKLPRYIEFIDELPMTPSQRIAKGQLSRARNAQEVDLESYLTRP
jgi:carnitine-CoA ligase